MKKYIKKLMHYFVKGAYAVGYREMADTNCHFDDTTEFKVIEPSLSRWYADSFPFVIGDDRYIFAEIMDDKNGEKGTIGVCHLGVDKDFVEIINEPFHMSFPNVFAYENDIYMMPETSEANQLRLYRASEFPYKWSLCAVLDENIQIVDTVILPFEENLYLIGQMIPDKKNIMYRLSMENLKAERIPLDGNYLDKRPAGNFISYPDGIYHALQECDRVYGEYLHVCKVNDFDGRVLNESEVCRYGIEQMKVLSNRKYRRVHTFNRSENLEVIDLLYYQCNPLILWNKLKGLFKRKHS